MVDNVGGASSGDAMMAQLLQNALNASQQQTNAADSDNKRDDAIQHQLVQKHAAKQAVEESHQRAQTTKESYTTERAVDKNWRALAEGKAGPELMQFANQANLQGKVSGKLKEMFLATQAADPGRAEEAAGVMNRLVTTQTFSQIAPTARDVGELAARVLENPAVEHTLTEVLSHPFVQAKDGDKGTKQDLARFASRQTDAQAMGKGASVRMAGDMLGSLAGAKVPGFAQQASLKMAMRNPQNAEGIKNVDAFVKEPAVRAMPQMARGYATQVLAKGDGKTDLKNSLTNVAKNENFRAMGREDKGKLFATVGQGRASELRAITDQTLTALRQKDFPRQAHQVESFLGGLGRQIGRGAKQTGDAGGTTADTSGEASNSTGGVDPEELLSLARRGGLPARPTLRRIPGSDEGERSNAGKNAADADNKATQAAGEASPEASGETSEAAAAGHAATQGPRPASRPANAGAAEQARAKALGTDLQRTLTSTLPQPGRPGTAGSAGAKEPTRTKTLARGSRVQTDKEDEGRQVQNRASLQAYFSKVTRHYDRLEQKIKDAEYFEDVNQLSGLKAPEELDLSDLSVRPEVADNYDGKLTELKSQLDSRQIPRLTYTKQLKAVQAEAFSRADLSTDEKSYVYAKTAQAQAGQTFQELSGKKHRKLREVKNKLLPAEKRRQRLEPRRPQGVQPRFFRAGGQSAAAPGAQAASRAAAQQPAGPGASTPASRTAQAATAQPQAARQPQRSGGARTSQTRDILRKIDTSLSRTEQVQQAKELLAQDIQQQAMQMAGELMEAIMNGTAGSSGAGGGSNANAVQTSGAGATNLAASPPPAATTTGKTNFYGVPQSFERDLGATAHSRPVRAPGSRAASSRGAGALDEEATQTSVGKALMKDNAQLRPLGELRQLRMKDMTKLEANALKNLGWDAVSWGAQGQPGAPTPTTYQTPYNQLRPLQKDSVRALGLSEDGWNSMVARNSGP